MAEINIRLSEWILEGYKREVKYIIAEPEKGRLSKDPAFLIALSGAGIDTHKYPQNIPIHFFVREGHRAASFDLPYHGERHSPGSRNKGIAGFCESVISGEDPFKEIVDDGSRLIDECLKRGYAGEGKIFVHGVSRGAYCVLRLAAALFEEEERRGLDKSQIEVRFDPRCIGHKVLNPLREEAARFLVDLARPAAGKRHGN